MLTFKTRKHFRLLGDPFMQDITSKDDVYLTPGIQFAIDYLVQTAQHGGMLALLGESGAGKTIIRRYAVDKMLYEGHKLRIIMPRSIDKKKLSAATICEAIIGDCSSELAKRGIEAKSRQVERILIESSRAGLAHVLIIEEAHDLALDVLKQLKRFWELEDGFKKLLAIVLVGQPELQNQLDEARNFGARELIRRMEVLHLEPLSPKEVRDYLDLKFARLDLSRADYIEDAACTALVLRLCRQTTRHQVISGSYPLIINKWMSRALNSAAELGAPLVDAAIINAL